jgi:hypothetical protein
VNIQDNNRVHVLTEPENKLITELENKLITYRITTEYRYRITHINNWANMITETPEHTWLQQHQNRHD